MVLAMKMSCSTLSFETDWELNKHLFSCEPQLTQTSVAVKEVQFMSTATCLRVKYNNIQLHTSTMSHLTQHTH